jgi:hypothetical protein
VRDGNAPINAADVVAVYESFGVSRGYFSQMMAQIKTLEWNLLGG